MLSPFPGMNPYLENPGTWPNVHHRLITAIADSLAPQLRPKYLAIVEQRIFKSSGENALLVGIPDVAVQRSQSTANPASFNVAVLSPLSQPRTVEIPMPQMIKQGYLEIRDVPTGEVVTVIEVLSPVNKRPGEGRKVYELKRQKILGSSTNFVEIDLLRQWEAMRIANNDIQSHYRILVSRSNRRPLADLYAFNLADVIPSFPLPLRGADVEPVINLQPLLQGVYERSGYDLVIDYNREPVPPLSDADAIWADTLLREQKLRG